MHVSIRFISERVGDVRLDEVVEGFVLNRQHNEHLLSYGTET